MTRYISGELAQPITSVRKDPRSAVIPPFSFVGELEIGISGFWYPTATMELKRASLSASGPGESNAIITILKQEAGVPDPLTIGSFELGTETTKQIISLNDTLVTPFDKIYMASWADSYHTGVVIQLTGVMMT